MNQDMTPEEKLIAYVLGGGRTAGMTADGEMPVAAKAYSLGYTDGIEHAAAAIHRETQDPSRAKFSAERFLECHRTITLENVIDFDALIALSPVRKGEGDAETRSWDETTTEDYDAGFIMGYIDTYAGHFAAEPRG